MVCDSFKVNILLVSPDKKWIIAGTKENYDLSLKVFEVVFDYIIVCVACSRLFLRYLCANTTRRKIDKNGKYRYIPCTLVLFCFFCAR